MYKYEMDPTRTVGATERTRDAGRADGQTEWNQYTPQQLRGVGGIMNIFHYNDVIMSAMASQITSLMIVYSMVYSRRRSKKTSKLHVTGLCAGNSRVTGEFPTQRASNVENVSIWWCHHVILQLELIQSNRLNLRRVVSDWCLVMWSSPLWWLPVTCKDKWLWQQ